jgi:Asp-tRNA(Asn)/Glu-tRNA(Gln) amidotransferase A subunit family amidase
MKRRSLLQLPAVAAIATQAPAQQAPPPAVPQRISKEQVTAALQVLGLDFSPEQVELMLRGVNRGLTGYEDLRKIDVPLDTEPAFAYHPGLPGRQVGVAKARYKPTVKKSSARAFKSIEDLAFLPVTELAPLLRSKKVSSTDLTKMYLERLKKFSPKLLCVITLTESLALEQAARADQELRQGKYRGPLHGIPWGAKDLFATKGIPTTWGAEPYQNQVIDRDATIVKRLADAGAVLVAKLSMGALAQGGLWFGGMTKTPWNIEKTSSGSSAGSASATAAGLVGFAIGTETQGSIISPSVACGTTGLRPTYGRVSRAGAMGLSWTMDKVGPICRGIEDLALVLHAIHGPDGEDRTVTADPFHWEPRKPLSGLRIGYLPKSFENFKGEDAKVYAQVLTDMAKAGITPQKVDEAAYEELESLGQKLRPILVAEATAAFDDITRDGRVSQLKGQNPGDWPNTFRTSRLIPAVEYIRAQRLRTLLQAKAEKFMANWDALLIPPFAMLGTTNLTGHPQVVMKCGFVEGAPRSISFLGKLYDEGTPLRLALAYEQVTNWHNQHPAMNF